MKATYSLMNQLFDCKGDKKSLAKEMSDMYLLILLTYINQYSHKLFVNTLGKMQRTL